MLGHIEMQYFATTVFQHDEHEQHPHRYRRHRKQINRHQLPDVVVKEGLSGLSGRPGNASQNARDCAFGDRDTEHFQFAMNARRTPQRIGNNHPLNQAANLNVCRGPASPTAMMFR